MTDDRVLRALLLLFCVTVLLAQQAHGYNKYSKEANDNVFNKERPFRMHKLNLLWEKASKKLDGKTLKNLLNDLKHQDKDEISLKKLKAENQDKEGLKEAQVRKQLANILRKYKLELEDNNQTVNVEPSEANDYEKPLFKDKKLDKLWKKAQKADLSEPQLKILKEELRHYEDKMGQYHQLISELNHKHEKDRARRDNLENHIDAFLELEEARKDLKIEETSDKLKEKHIELKNEYRRLSDMVHNASVNKKQLKGEFEEEKASKLWNLALKSDFTDEELDSLRDELLHFQNRIKKLNFFQAQLESDRMAGKKGVDEPLNDNDHHSDHDKHVARKVKELNHKVNKMHAEIENRILQRHSEL